MNTNVVPSEMDGRCKIARRIKQLANAFTTELGEELSAAQFDAVRRAAQLAALAEETRARFMAGDPIVTLTDVVRVEGTTRRAVADLHLPAAKDQAPDLDDFLSEIVATADDGARS